MSSMEISNITKETLKNMFSKGKRFDDRALLDFREIEISHNVSNKAEGSVRVKIGKTEVVVGIKLDVGEPFSDSPEKGNLICTGELLPLASPRFESGPPGFKAIELSRLIDRAIRGSGMIDFSKLVIKKGEKVWNIYIDIYPINDDGNLIDAATMGAVIALKHAKMPGLTDEEKADYSNKKDGLPISKETFPLSFSFFKLGSTIILDPTREEEEASESRITFGISKWGKQYMINSCQKADSCTFTQKELEEIMEIIPKKFDEINKKLRL